MGLSQINDIDLMNEKKSLNKLFECSDSFTSVVFNSGAGSGKTYALIQCLKYIISIHHDDLKNHNQKIGCITYTNVAAEHIKHQLGVSDVVEYQLFMKNLEYYLQSKIGFVRFAY